MFILVSLHTVLLRISKALGSTHGELAAPSPFKATDWTFTPSTWHPGNVCSESQADSNQ